jgi:hypothetical protein
VDLPGGGKPITSDPAPAQLNAPSVETAPSRYPFTRLALHGNAGGAARVFVEGAGNPAESAVQPLDGTFCIVVDLAAAPAEYTLTLQSQSGDGRLSAPVQIKVDRANDAPPPSDATLCDGSAAQ